MGPVFCSVSFISISSKITMGGTFFMYTCVTALAWCFYCTSLPETKGRSLEDMEILFGGHSKSEVKSDKSECKTTSDP